MERRQHARIPASYSVQFSILGENAVIYEGSLKDISEGGVRVVVPRALRPGAFLKLKVGTSLFFGEVRFCCPWMGSFVAGVVIEPSLAGEENLADVMVRALREPAQKIAG